MDGGCQIPDELRPTTGKNSGRDLRCRTPGLPTYSRSLCFMFIFAESSTEAFREWSFGGQKHLESGALADRALNDLKERSQWRFFTEDAADPAGSCYGDSKQPANFKISEEIATALFWAKGDDPANMEDVYGNHNLPSNSEWSIESEIPQGDIKCLLIECAKAIADNRNADKLIAKLRQAVSIFGDPMQRLGAYMVEGLVARLQFSGGHIYRTLKCKEPTSSELLSYMQIFYRICPYFRFGYMAANAVIVEALNDKDRVHIIDFQIAQGTQWVPVIQAFAARQGGSPHVRITGVDDPVSEFARGQGLQLVGQRLSNLAETYQVPFEFHALSVYASDVDADMLDIRPGEALVVNFHLLLHHIPDESVSTNNHRDRLIRMVKGMAPTVVTLVEQEANTNTARFFPRFMETLSYYTAMFESLDLTLPRESKERVSVEQHCLARDIVNIIACEGAERVERHELFGKWRSRLTMAGFKSHSLSSRVNATIKVALESYNQNYRVVEKDDVLYLGWLGRDLFVSSAWK